MRVICVSHGSALVEVLVLCGKVMFSGIEVRRVGIALVALPESSGGGNGARPRVHTRRGCWRRECGRHRLGPHHGKMVRLAARRLAKRDERGEMFGAGR